MTLEQGCARLQPVGNEADNNKTSLELGSDHLGKLQRSALSLQQIAALGWRSLPNGRLSIPYRKPDGSPELCHNGKPFTRCRLSERELAEAKAKGERIGKYRSPSGNGCRLYHSALAIAAVVPITPAVDAAQTNGQALWIVGVGGFCLQLAFCDP